MVWPGTFSWFYSSFCPVFHGVCLCIGKATWASILTTGFLFYQASTLQTPKIRKIIGFPPEISLQAVVFRRISLNVIALVS